MFEVRNRILSIDPGMKDFGVTISNVVNGKLVREFTYTYDIDRVVKLRCSQLALVHGDREAKRAAVTITVSELLHHWQPYAVVIEAAHFKGIVAAYRSLIECIACVQASVFANAPYMPFTQIAASAVKVAVGVNGQSGEKNDIQDALPLLPDLDLNGADVTQFDQHSNDSIAVGYAFYHMYIKGKC